MGIHPVDAFAVGDTHHLQKLYGTGLDIFLTETIFVMQSNNLVHLGANTEHRI